MGFSDALTVLHDQCVAYFVVHSLIIETTLIPVSVGANICHFAPRFPPVRASLEDDRSTVVSRARMFGVVTVAIARTAFSEGVQR